MADIEEGSSGEGRCYYNSYVRELVDCDSTILTSCVEDSMEEASALASNVAILATRLLGEA